MMLRHSTGGPLVLIFPLTSEENPLLDDGSFLLSGDRLLLLLLVGKDETVGCFVVCGSGPSHSLKPPLGKKGSEFHHLSFSLVDGNKNHGINKEFRHYF